MTAIFLKILNMSLTGIIIASVVVILRLLLRRAPRSLVCALWILVGLRLALPFSFESPVSLMPESVPVTENVDGSIVLNTGIGFINSTIGTVTESQSETVTPPSSSDVPSMPEAPSITLPEIDDTADTSESYSFTEIAAVVWAIGCVLMLIYAAASYLRIRHKVRESARLEGNLYICDGIPSPFILGIIRPRIYIPSSTSETDRVYIISHEKAHLRRLDHIWKPLGFALLAVHWFNPVMWLCYVLLCRDIELACDEKVIRKLGDEAKKPYSSALISASVPRRLISACPLAFGEVGVKKRIKAVLSYKKPTLWIIIAAVLALTVTAACLLTDKKTDENEHDLCIEAQSSSCDMDGVWAEITATDVENGKLTVVWHNDTDHELDFGEEFYIYRIEDDGKTIDTYTYPEEYAWNLVAYPVVPGGSFEKEYNVAEHEILMDTPHRYETYFHITGSNPVPDGLKKYTLSIDFVTSESFIPESVRPAETDTPDLPTPELATDLEKVEAADDITCTVILSEYSGAVSVTGDDAKALFREVASNTASDIKYFSVSSEQPSISLSFTVNGFEKKYYFALYNNDTVQTEVPRHTTLCKGYELKSGTYEKVKALVREYFDGVPSDYHLGTWAQYNGQVHDTLAVTSVSRDAASFSVSVSKDSRVFTIDATAHENNGKFYFNEDVSTKFDAPIGLSGYLEFTANGITITFESFGIAEIEGQPSFEKVYNYTVKLSRDTVVYTCQGTKEALPPSLTLFPTSGQFSFTYSYLSSYIANGLYGLTNDTLTLRTDDGLYTYVFDVTSDDSLRFNSAKSSPLPKYKYSAGAAEAEVPFENGALFTKVLDKTNAIPSSVTIGEALSTIYPDTTLDKDSVVKIFLNSHEYDEKYANVEDRETISKIIDTIKNAPLVKYEKIEAAPGAATPLIFYGEGSTVIFKANIAESKVVFNYSHVFTVSDGYFAELCELIMTLQYPEEPASLEEVVSETKTLLKDYGWTDITVIDGEVDTKALVGSVITPEYKLEENERLTSITAKGSYTIASKICEYYVIIRIAENTETGNARVAETIYPYRHMQGNTLAEFVENYYKKGEILHANDRDLAWALTSDTHGYDSYEYYFDVDPYNVAYACTNDNEKFIPMVYLDTENGTFSFPYSKGSFYLPKGRYERTDTTLTLRTDDGLYTYVFKVVADDGLIFDAESSSQFPEYKSSEKYGRVIVPFEDGVLFRKVLDSDGGNSETTDVLPKSLVEQGKNHTVEYIYTDEGLQCGFLAKVYSDDGELLGEMSSRTGCHVEYQTVDGEKVVLVWAQYGTGRSVRNAVFYRTSDGKVSEVFTYYLDSANGLVVYGLLDGVMVRHIFDENSYSKKFDTFEIPFADDFLEPFDAVISKDGKHIEITYRIKTDDGLYSTNTEIFEL